MGKAAAFLTVALIAAAVTWRLLAPRLLNSPAPVPAASTAQIQPAAGTSADTAPASFDGSAIPNTQLPALAPATPPAQQQDAQREAQRQPYYQWILQTLPGMAQQALSEQADRADLLIYLTNCSNDTAYQVVQKVVATRAIQYGFTHVRLYSPPADGSAGWHLSAEADLRSGNRWELAIR